MRPYRSTLAALGLAALLGTTACDARSAERADDRPPGQAESAGRTRGETAEETAVDTTGWDAERKESPADAPWHPTVLERVEATGHDGHDTVTFTFAEGTPHYIAVYEDELWRHGGEDDAPVDVPGAHGLRVVLAGATADPDVPLTGTTDTVRGLAHLGAFEGEVHVGVGVGAEGTERPGFDVTTDGNTLTVRVAHP